MTGETAIRQSIIDACARTNATGLNQGTSGNISLRHNGGLLITPTSMSYDVMVPSDIAFLPALARDGCDGLRTASSEWRFHRDIYAARPEIGAIVHTHSTYATVLSMLRLPIPAAHYMIAVFGGNDIRCSDYATFGTPELSAVVLKALAGRFGALIGTHGMGRLRRGPCPGHLAHRRAGDLGAPILPGASGWQSRHPGRRRD